MGCQIIEGLDGVGADLAGCVLTIGNFDGVHLGHQRLLARAGELARSAGVKLAALTFDPSPTAVLAPDKAPERITPSAVKCRLLAEAGADAVVTVATTWEFLSVEPERFVREVIAERFEPRCVVEGENFFFGRRRAGNVELLAKMAAGLGFEVIVVGPAMVDLPSRGRCRVSSSLVRELIVAGDVSSAGSCLGRPFTLYGRVVGGAQLGRVLKYPTANVDPDGLVVPGDGIYAGRSAVAGVECPAAISVGNKPTFGPAPRTIEANLIDAEGDFYDKAIAVTFVQRLRDQVKFPDAASLKAQIAKDVQRVREICG